MKNEDCAHILVAVAHFENSEVDRTITLFPPFILLYFYSVFLHSSYFARPLLSSLLIFYSLVSFPSLPLALSSSTFTYGFVARHIHALTLMYGLIKYLIGVLIFYIFGLHARLFFRNVCGG
jgi:hypothetical protein